SRRPDSGAVRWTVRTPAEELLADRVVVATPESAARALLGPIMGDADPDRPAPRVHIVTLVVDADELDAAPRGSGVLTVPGTHVAKALTHATAKWPWLRERASAAHT